MDKKLLYVGVLFLVAVGGYIIGRNYCICPQVSVTQTCDEVVVRAVIDPETNECKLVDADGYPLRDNHLCTNPSKTIVWKNETDGPIQVQFGDEQTGPDWMVEASISAPPGGSASSHPTAAAENADVTFSVTCGGGAMEVKINFPPPKVGSGPPTP